MQGPEDFEPTGSKDRCVPRFFIKAVLNQDESTEDAPVFDDVEYVEIFLPGSSTSRPVQRVNDKHRKRWPKYYEAFKQGLEYEGEGFPLREWPRMTEGERETLASQGIYTVEQLAEMTEDVARGFGGTRYVTLCNLAQKYLKGQDSKDDQIAKLKEENGKLAERLAALEEKVNSKPEAKSRATAKKAD